MLKKVVCSFKHLINLKTDNVSILWDLPQAMKEMVGVTYIT